MRAREFTDSFSLEKYYILQLAIDRLDGIKNVGLRMIRS